MEIFYFNKVERKTDNADFSIKLWEKGNVKEHSHADYFEIVIPTGESFINYVDSDRKLMSIRDIAIIPPGPSHFIRSIAGQGIELYNVAIREKYFRNFIRSYETLQEILSKKSPVYITVDVYTYNFLTNILSKIDNKKYNERFLMFAETILHTIMSHLYIGGSETTTKKKDNYLISFCKDAIWKIDTYSYISQNITDIYGQYPVSRTAFSTEFKKLTGKKPIDYLIEKKIEYAKNLILTTDLSILEITNALGYDSTSAFIRKFKSIYGVPPLQYRKQNKHIQTNVLNTKLTEEK